MAEADKNKKIYILEYVTWFIACDPEEKDRVLNGLVRVPLG
jgi:hypothetical protein